MPDSTPAAALGLPSAVLMHLLYSFFAHPWDDETAPTARARLLDDADEVLALVPPGFDTPCPLPANTTYVGPIAAPQPRPPLDRNDAASLAEPGDPWVLLSLSTDTPARFPRCSRRLRRYRCVYC